ncbi:PAS domain-containing protein [Kiloniella antarctica]|uniref:PAS domain-containing protein n=1 Tax=Kiloniella antarctica TaxID=1550907 RepID=A0ABW5BSP1_9PROT
MKDITYSTEYLWARAKELVNEDYVSLSLLMKQLGSPVPTVHWNLPEDKLPQPELQFLFKWWKDKKGERMAPSPSDVDPFELKGILGKIAVLEVIDTGEEFKYRLYGSAIMPEPGKDLTGKLLSDIWTPMRAFFAITYRAVVLRKEPLYTRHEPHHSLKMAEWDRIILPLSDGTEVERIIVALVPVKTEE